jgi:hypothetical protein
MISSEDNLNLPSKCITVNRPVLESIHPRIRRGAGSVGIAVAISTDPAFLRPFSAATDTNVAASVMAPVQSC